MGREVPDWDDGDEERLARFTGAGFIAETSSQLIYDYGHCED